MHTHTPAKNIDAIQRLALTTGEPAGIGPDLAIMLSQTELDCEVICIGCERLLQQRAKLLGLTINITFVTVAQLQQTKAIPNQQYEVKVLTINTATEVIASQLDVANAHYVMQILDTAIAGCSEGWFDAMVTAPVQKSVICEAGFVFSGHTEYLAEQTHTDKVVMMLATEQMRVALVTTHIPLKDVADAITPELLEKVTRILHHDLQQYFALESPRILVAGLNPHAGEDGHLGREEIDTISPCLEKLRQKGLALLGPLPADTLFTDKYLDNADAVLAMYHDQGLPVLKYHGFGKAANITLGLPIIRTSVDHGTALDLAGTGQINPGSLNTAIKIAQLMASKRTQ